MQVVQLSLSVYADEGKALTTLPVGDAYLVWDHITGHRACPVMEGLLVTHMLWLRSLHQIHILITVSAVFVGNP